MGKKEYLACLISLVMLCLTACSDNANKTGSEVSSGTSSAEEKDYGYGFDKFGFSRFDVETAESLTYENKTKIVYLTNYDTTFTTTDDDPRIYDEIYIENTVNEYLDKNGYDFYVDFVMNGEFDFKTGELYPNMDVYESMFKNNEQVDIVNTGLGMSALGGYGDTFNLFVERGYLEPLNDYFQTDSGKAFYDGFDGIVWKQTTCADGMIYGKTTDYTLAQPLVLLLNGDVCNEYGVNTDDIQSLEDLEPYLQSLADEGKRGLLLDSTCELYYEMAGFCRYKGVYINAETGLAENIFENEKALKYLKTVYEYSQNGYISNNVDIANDAYICSLSPAMPLYYDSSKIVSSGYLQQEELNGVVGISSSSKNKETAFELLALLNTDEELANIIYNGAEGRNYAVKDGEKYPNKNALPFYDVAATMTNSIIAESNSQDNQSKREDIAICWEHSEVSPFYGLEVSDDLAEKLEKTAAVYDDFYGLFYGDYGEYQSLDEALFAANEQLKAAGIDEVLNELNEQHGKFDKE